MLQTQQFTCPENWTGRVKTLDLKKYHFFLFFFPLKIGMGNRNNRDTLAHVDFAHSHSKNLTIQKGCYLLFQLHQEYSMCSFAHVHLTVCADKNLHVIKIFMS